MGSEFQVLDSILSSGTWIVVSNGQWDFGFLKLCSQSQRSRFWIPHQNYRGFQIPPANISWILLHGVLYTSGTAKGGGAVAQPPLTFSDGTFFLITYFGFPDLSLTTQTRFSNLTILNAHEQRTDKLCLVAVTNQFVAPNDNRRGNFGHIQRIRLKNVRVTLKPLHVLGLASKSIHFNFSLTWGPGCNWLF